MMGLYLEKINGQFMHAWNHGICIHPCFDEYNMITTIPCRLQACLIEEIGHLWEEGSYVENVIYGNHLWAV